MMFMRRSAPQSQRDRNVIAAGSGEVRTSLHVVHVAFTAFALRWLVVVVLLDLLLGRVLQRDFLSGRETREDLDAFEGRDTRLDRHDLEVLLPVVRQPDEFGAAGQSRLGGGDLLRDRKSVV